MSDQPVAISVVIPTFNEEGAIADVVQGLHQTLSTTEGTIFEIIVVNDGSTDQTGARIPQEKARVIHHPKNYGYGRAILTGIENAKYSLIGIIDADNTYDPRDLARMIPLSNIYDMVIGARDIKCESFMVGFLRWFLKGLVLFFTEHASLDPNSGLRIFRKEMVELGKNLFSKKFSFSTSLTFFGSLTHQFIEYVPIQYNARRGLSKVRHVRDSIRTFILIISMALVFQPVKCFLVHIVGCLLGMGALFLGKPLIGFEAWLAGSLMWLSVQFMLSLSFLAFIFSKANDQRHPFK